MSSRVLVSGGEWLVALYALKSWSLCVLVSTGLCVINMFSSFLFPSGLSMSVLVGWDVEWLMA